MSALGDRAESLLEQMESLTRKGQAKGYFTAGERSLFQSLESQVRAIHQQQQREQQHLERAILEQEGRVMREQIELQRTEAELRELKETRAFFQSGVAIQGRTSSTDKGTSILEFPVERRQLSTATGAAGLYTVPAFVADVIMAAQLEDEVLAMSTIITGDKRQPIYSPAFDDVANLAQLVAQNASYSSGPDLLFRRDELDKKSYRSGIFTCSIELLQDSAIESVLSTALGKRTGRRLASNLASALDGAHSVSSSKTAKRDKLSDLMNGCRYAHLSGTAFMMHPSQLNQTILQAEVAGLKCVQNIGGRYYVHGKPVLFNAYLPSVQDSPTASTVYFGLASRLVTVTNSFRVARFNERYAEFGQVAFELLFQSSDPVIAVGSATDYPIVKIEL